MRIVHFSDLHFGVFPSRLLSLPGKCLLGACNHLLRRRWHFAADRLSYLAARLPDLSPDLVICSGDLATIGIPEEFSLVRGWLKPILDWAGERFLFVPGNHDAYTQHQFAQEALAETFHELNQGRWQLPQLPVAIECQQTKIVLLDGTKPAPFWLSTGELSQAAGARLQEMLPEKRSAEERHLAVCHFPAFNQQGKPLGWRRRMQGAEILGRLLGENRLDALLCGHIHKPFTLRTSEKSLQICAGSLTLNKSFAIIDLLPGQEEIVCQHHSW